VFKFRKLLLVLKILDIFRTVDANSASFDFFIGEDTFVNECKVGCLNAVICALLLTHRVEVDAIAEIHLVETNVGISVLTASHISQGEQCTL
jgi:hypothetical protein